MRTHRAAVAEHYDSRAATYDRSSLHTALVRAVADMARDPGRTVVDVATGTGLMLRSLRSRWPESHVVGIDVSAGMLRSARQALPSAWLVRADAAELPLTEGSADLITCVTALHLFDDPDQVLNEWRRVLRPGGRILTATFASEYDSSDWKQQGFVRRHEAYRSPHQVSAFVSGAGFTVIAHTYWAHREHRLLICEAVRDDRRDC